MSMPPNEADLAVLALQRCEQSMTVDRPDLRVFLRLSHVRGRGAVIAEAADTRIAKIVVASQPLGRLSAFR
jgi:hypothetical protein